LEIIFIRYLGVRFSSKSGFYAELKDNFDGVVKIDADG
tara:strand:+ start:386 stop:499 length:114 start_codon:yes stop_codon:yes gene_type:complete